MDKIETIMKCLFLSNDVEKNKNKSKIKTGSKPRSIFESIENI